ncbi:hypothetical protein RND81_10G092800 [Saponaria officinalis]|uniref:Mediator complex subunit 15 KIX domain-containing protein n=2 Tax=Saponaria officinalis TaxID=3572 RepID=A0AAW1I079_SAPOF
MDSNNWRPNQGEAQPPPMDGGDWRSQLQPDSRQRIVNKIMETLKRHLPFSGQEGVQELKQIAIRFEEKIYSAATSQSDYLRKISLKMLTMESKSQGALPNAMPSNSAGRNPQDPAASQNMQSQVLNQNQSVPLQMAANQSQARQQLLNHNIPKNMVSGALQTGVSLPNPLPTNGLAQNTVPNVAQNSNMQNTSSISQNSMGNTMNPGIASSMFSNAQRQLQGRQQHLGSQQQHQQSQNSQQFMYQQQQQQLQLKHQLMQHNLQQQNIQQPLMQTQQQQQTMQTSSVMQPSITGLQQNQQASIQQPTQSVLQQHQQSMIRQQSQQTPAIQQQQVLGQQLNAGNMQQSQLIGQQPNYGGMQQTQLIGQQPNVGNTQQSQLIGQQPNAGNKQQSQLIGQQPTVGNLQQSQLTSQQSNILDMQQQQQQQQRLLAQQNNIQNLAPQQPTSHQNLQQQQHLLGQQNNLQNIHQQQLGHQSHVGGQQLMGTQSGNASMQTSQQQSVQMMQPTKVPMQQQTQNALSGGSGQQQLQSQSQQQLMSQLQSQPTQVQQQLPMQPQSNALLHNMHQRMQNMNPLLQQQNLTDQQKLFQAQRATPEAPSSSLDSTAQTGSVNGGDWQEEVYQKIKSMKDLYYADLNEMYQKISFKLQQHDSLPQQPKIEQIEKLRQFKNMLDRLMQVLQITKNNISPSHKEKLPSFEKQIVSLLNPSKPRKPPQLHSYQQQHPQIPQAQSHDGAANSQMQSMNIPSSGATMQQSSLTNLKHGSVSTLSAVTSLQQSIPSSLQPSNFDSGQASAPSSMQQGAASSMQINTVSAPHQANTGAMQPQGGVSLLHQNVNNIHTNTNMLQNQHLKQQHEQQHSKQHILNKMQLQKQQILQQQLNQQGQQPSQMQAHQMAQLQQLNDVNEKMRHLKSGAFAQHLSSAQRFMNHQVKPGASFPVSSPQLLNAVSPQINHHSSPQIDTQNLPPSVSKGGTPLHSANSPFVPSPSTPLVPSPMPGDHEKPAVSSLSNAANVGQQTNGAIAAPQSLSIGTPGISPSPLFECAGPDGTLGNASATISGKSSVTELPIERLLRAVKSASPKALTAAISDISSVVSMVDRIAGSAPGNGSRATVGEDLVAMTKCRLQARNILTQDGSSGAKRMRRYTSAMPLHMGASAGSGNDSLKQLNGPFTPELESTATSGVKKARIEVNHALLEEIREINERLIDTVVSISDEDMSPSMAALAVEGSEGIVVKCSYNAITLSPSFRSQFISAEMSPIQPLKLLVPDAYPNCSPILLDKLPIGVSNEHEDLSVKAKSRFSVSLRSLSQPMSLKDIARTWDDSARAVISEYAQRFGGGTFSSKYGTWENCLSAA